MVVIKKVDVGGKKVLLSDFIKSDPDAIIGISTQETFGELPYLFKVLAADKVLPIQVQPSKAQAEIGFEKEDAAGISRNAGNRNYKDLNHKPELVFALTPYQAMNGFRDIPDIVMLFETLNISVLHNLVSVFSAQKNEQGLQVFFKLF